MTLPTYQVAALPIVAVAIVLVLSGCQSAATPSSSPATVDVLAYLIGDASPWPRSGNHGQNKIVRLARRGVCCVKYGNPRRFECWRWDDQFVYHAVDHGLDGDSNESYMFTNGRWLARYLPVDATALAPWTMDVVENQLVWFDATCRVDALRS